MDIRKIMTGRTAFTNTDNRIPREAFEGREGREAREFSQGWAHGKQGRTDLLGISDDYDAGYTRTTAKVAA